MMKKLFKNQKIKNVFLVIMSAAIIFALNSFGVFNTKAAGTVSITKTDDGQTIQLTQQSTDHTYNIDYEMNFPLADDANFLFTVGEEAGDSGDMDNICRYNKQFSTKNCFEDTGWAGKALVNNGNYIYITDDSKDHTIKFELNSDPSAEKFLREVGRLNRDDISGGISGGSGITTDGEYVYISDNAGYICRYDNDLSPSSQLCTTQNISGYNLTTDGTYLYAPTSSLPIVDGTSNGVFKIRAGDMSVEDTMYFTYADYSMPYNLTYYNGFLYGGRLDRDNGASGGYICKYSTDFDAPNETCVQPYKDTNPIPFYSDKLYSNSSVIIYNKKPKLIVYGWIEGKPMSFGIFDLNTLSFEEYINQDIDKYPNSLSSFPSLGLHIIDEYPAGTSYVSTGLDNCNENEGKVICKNYEPGDNGSGKEFKINIPKNDTICALDEITNKISIKVPNFRNNLDEDSVTTPINCPAFSQMLKVNISWLEGNRPENVEMKTILKDVR